MSKYLKRLWFTFAGLIIAIAIIFSLFRALTPWVKQYKAQVEQHLTTLIGAPVTIETMKTGWYWFKPVIKLKDVKVWEKNKANLELDRLFVGINILQSLWHWQIQPGILYIDQIHLTLKKQGEGWAVEGLPQGQQLKESSESYKPLLGWILNQQKIIVHQLSCDIYLKEGKPLVFRDLNLTMTRSLSHYRIKGKVTLDQKVPTDFEWYAKLVLNPEQLQSFSGQAYLSSENLQPTQWQEIFPFPLDQQFVDGKGDIQIWTDWVDGQLKNLQSNLNFDQLAWNNKSNANNKNLKKQKKSQTIPSLKANVAWKSIPGGWELSTDHLNFVLNNVTWPENTLLLSFKEDSQTYFAYIEHLLIDSLSSLDVAWPEMAKKIVSLAPKGRLEDTRFQIKDKTLDYVLTHFSNLSWKPSEKIPGVQNISGTLRWQPEEGRAEIDGEETILQSINQDPIKFSMLNTALDWKMLANGLRVSMSRFVLTHPSFLVSAQGVADELTRDSLGPLRLTANFSGVNAHQWLQYIPSKYLKKGLEDWLKKDIKEIQKVDGQLVINGDMKDFPFDNHPGEFSVKSYLSGSKLIMMPQWPLVSNLEGYLSLNKRNLDAKITHATLGEVPLKEGNLRIDNIGLDRETLLVHATTDTDGPNALKYIRTSPLNNRLGSLQQLSIQGPLTLNLKLEVPLFGENETVFVQGDLTANKNVLKLPKISSGVQFNNLNGDIKFDQNGILSGNLNGEFLKNPIQFSLKSVQKPVTLTQIDFNSKVNIETISNQIKLPAGSESILKGSFGWDGALLIPNDSKTPPQLKFKSDLQGLGIDLPSPLGKSPNTKTPVSVLVELNQKKPLLLNFNYNNLFSGALRFVPQSKGDLIFKQGEIWVGEMSVRPHSKENEGLQIYGKLPSFNIEQWQTMQNKFQSHQAAKDGWDGWKIVNRVEVLFEKAKVLNGSYKNLLVKVIKADAGAWAIELDEEKLKANLYYQPMTNTLTGIFNHLKLDLPHTGEKWHNHLNPTDIPSLELKVDSFQVGTIHLGELILKTKSLPNQLQINDFKLISPYYQLIAKAKWRKDDSFNDTSLEADLISNNFSQMLSSWDIEPMVKGTKGTVSFQGSWKGPFYDFSLGELNGKMTAQLKNGRITNLSSSTQEKIGFGKLLSILSLQTIPRRLKLDFSDLSEEGYSFDRFNGSFNLNKGIMTTRDSDIDGPVAYASIKGSIDLVKQLFDVDLSVYPHITASLPVVATIAGGPIAGIATWAASKIIDEGMQRITGYTYKVSGPWSQPVVQQVKIFKRR